MVGVTKEETEAEVVDVGAQSGRKSRLANARRSSFSGSAGEGKRDHDRRKIVRRISINLAKVTSNSNHLNAN